MNTKKETIRLIQDLFQDLDTILEKISALDDYSPFLNDEMEKILMQVDDALHAASMKQLDLAQDLVKRSH